MNGQEHTRRATRRGHLSRAATWCGTAVFIAVGILGLGTPSHAAGPGTDNTSGSSAGPSSTFGSFTALGRSDGFSLEVDDPSAPLVPKGQLIFATDSSTQAQLDSLGESQAFASVPYPGPLVATLPNLVNGLTAGQFPPLPTYPLYVSSQYPTTPSDVVTQGPYQMSAISGTTDSKALGVIGVSASAPSVAEVSTSAEATQNADGSVSATAQTDVKGVDFGAGSLLQIDGVQTSASASRASGAALHTSSKLSAANISIGGIGLSLTDQGLQVAGTSIPIPGIGSTLASLLGSLASSGITLTYLPAKQLPDGVQSAALQVIEQQKVPGQGNVVVTVTIGGVMATIDSTVVSAVSGSSSPLPGSSLPSTPFTMSPIISGLPSSSVLPSTSTPSSVSSTGSVPGGSTPQQITELIRNALPLKGSASVFYLALMAGALLALMATELFRRLGVQLQLFRRSRR